MSNTEDDTSLTLIQQDIDEALEPQFDEIELKMVKAQLYFELMGLDLFEDVEPEFEPIAEMVRNEVMGFVKNQLNELMGNGSKKTQKKMAKAAPKVAASSLANVLKRKNKVINKKAVEVQPTTAPTQVYSHPPDMAATETDDYITVETELPGGKVLTKVYRRMVDNATNNDFYLGFDSSAKGELIPDGNKYRMDVGPSGNQIFRVISSQTLPPGVKEVRPVSKAAFEAEMHAHAASTYAAVRKGMANNPLLAQLIDKSQNS